MSNKSLEQLWKKGTDFLGTDHAIMGGAMSWISERNLVSAISNSGCFGVIACGAMSVDMLREEIIETQKLTDKPFGVNLITMHPDLDELVDICGELKVTHLVLAGGLPKTATIQRAKESGMKVICFAPAALLAKKIIKSGADAIVIEGSEAGGHIGPVSTSVLAQEIIPFVNEEYPDIPVFVAGGIARGETIASYLQMGASGVQLGTAFVCTDECIAHENFKKLFIKSKAKDATISVQIDPDLPVIPVRAIENKATIEFENLQRTVSDEYRNGDLDKTEAQLKIERFWAGALRNAVIDGDVEKGSVMAGQSVGMVKSVQPVSEVVSELISQAGNFLNR